jgi:hypothetical protein
MLKQEQIPVSFIITKSQNGEQFFKLFTAFEQKCPGVFIRAWLDDALAHGFLQYCPFKYPKKTCYPNFQVSCVKTEFCKILPM